MIADVPGCEAYIDDVIIYSDTWNAHLNQISKFFAKLKAANLTVNFLKASLVVLKFNSLASLLEGER